MLRRSAAPVVVLAMGIAWPAGLVAQDPLEVARRVLAVTPLIDGHNDLPWRIRSRATPGVREAGPAAMVAAYDLRGRAPGHTDLTRLRAGGVGGQLWSVYVPCGMAAAESARMLREQVALARVVFAAHPDALRPVGTADELEAAFREGRIGSMLAIEGAHALEGSLEAVRSYRDLGVRAVGLTHECSNTFADAARAGALHGGLSTLGRELVAELGRLGMLVDLAHASVATMHGVLDVASAPVIWSHAAARALVDHPRNVPDEVLRRLPANGGVLMIAFVPAFVSDAQRAWEVREGAERRRLEDVHGRGDPRVARALEEWRRADPAPGATLAQVADHVEHVRAVAGVDHVGLGSDFDGIGRVVRGLEDVSTYPALLAELTRRGWTEEELGKLAGGNVLRVLRAAEAAARASNREEP